MVKVEEIIHSYFDEKDGMMRIGEFEVSEIIRRYGSPIYVYNVSLIRKIYQRLKSGLKDAADIFYSLKANPSLAMCGLFYDLGAGAEIGSSGELEIARKAGFPGDRIVFAGPGKSEDELRAAIQSDILSINVESMTEIADIAKLCRQEGRKANIGIRVNPNIDRIKLKVQMGGGPRGFGIDEEHLEEVCCLIRGHRTLNLVGIHVYVGTQILDHNQVLRNVKDTFRIAKRVNQWLAPVRLKMIDFGGGFGVPYYRKDPDFDCVAFTKGFKDIMREQNGDGDFAGTRFILELGRFLIARSGVYLAEIRYVKQSRGKWFVILNGGMNHIAIATHNLGQPIKRRFPLAVVNKIERPKLRRVQIMGPLCTPLDSFGSDIEVPEIERGDIVGIFNSGAYGLTASPVNFLSHPTCAELFIDGDSCQCTRRRGEPADLFHGQDFFRYPMQTKRISHDHTGETQSKGDCITDADR